MAGGAVVLQRGDVDVRCVAGMPRLLSLAPAWEEEGGAGEGGGGGGSDGGVVCDVVWATTVVYARAAWRAIIAQHGSQRCAPYAP